MKQENISTTLSMMNKKRIAMIGAGVGVIAVAVLAYNLTDTSLLKGDIDRKSTQSNKAPWWCLKPPTQSITEERAPSPGSGTATPRKTRGSGESKESSSNGNGSRTVSRKIPGPFGGVARFDPNSNVFKIDPGLSGIDIPSTQLEVPLLDWMKYTSTIKDGGSGGNSGRGGGTTPGVGPIVPKKNVKEYYNCSCNATIAELKSVPGYILYCPAPGDSIEQETTDANGIIHTITVTTSSSEICEEPLKEGEFSNIGYTCGCDQKTFTEPKTGITDECPSQGKTKVFNGEYKNGGNYKLQINVQPDFLCKDDWQCVDGWDWNKIKEDCAKLKVNQCSGKAVFPETVATEKACKAFQPVSAFGECLDFDKCKESMDLVKAGKSQEAFDKGLPNTFECGKLYGFQGSDIWN